MTLKAIENFCSINFMNQLLYPLNIKLQIQFNARTLSKIKLDITEGITLATILCKLEIK